MKNPLKVIWSGWKKFAHGVALVQTKIIMTMFYFVFIALASLVIKLLRRHILDTSSSASGGAWMERGREVPDMERCRRQF